MDRELNMTINELKQAVSKGREVTIAPGIMARGKGFQLSFLFRGRRCRETLKLELTQANIRYAMKTLSAIQLDIEKNGTFNYLQYFPNGKNGHRYGVLSSKRTVDEALRDWLKKEEPILAYSTYEDYRKSVENILIPAFSNTLLSELTPRQIQIWVDARTSSAKRTRNVLLPLSAVLSAAFRLEEIRENPLERVEIRQRASNHAVTPDKVDDSPTRQEKVDPFSLAEIRSIFQTLEPEPQVHNYFKLAVWTGLRTSELVGLRWSQIDLSAQTLEVRLAKVKGRHKRPKTAAGHRLVKLLPPAIEALQEQWTYTGEAGEEVFHDPRYQAPWSGDKPIRECFWKPALKEAGVRYRRPYQCRHTYASLMLTAGEPPLWVADQMGHEDWGMIRKVYGSWIPDYQREAGNKAVEAWARFRQIAPDSPQNSGKP